MITDYAGRNYTFNVKIIYPFMNSRFAQLKNLIQPRESLIFVVGQMEIINNSLYINAKDISCISTNSTNKKITECDQQTLTSTKSSRSKLLSIHQSMIETSGETSQKNLKSPNFSDFTDNSHYDMSQTNPRPLKRTKNSKISEYKDLSENSTDDELNTEKLNNNIDLNQKHEDIEIKTNNTTKKKSTCNPRKGKRKITQPKPVVHNTRRSRKNATSIDEQ